MNDLKIPVGISDFTKIRENGYYYIDKTELICSLLEPEPAEVTLITRPRRFGKTAEVCLKVWKFWSMKNFVRNG